GAALVSAGLVNLVFGAITLRENVRHVDRAVDKAISDNLQPIRESLYKEAQYSYRWTCLLKPPKKDDNHPEYAYQFLNISYALEQLLDELRGVCISTDEDGVLEQFSDERYLIRWMVDEGFDPSSEEVFRFGNVKVDGQSITQASKMDLNLDQGKGTEYRFEVPGDKRFEEHPTIEYSVMFRKYIGTEKRFSITSQLFSLTTDAEYRLFVSDDISVERIAVSTSQVTPVGPKGVASCDYTFTGSDQKQTAHAIFQFPLQSGSSINFNIERE
ncbi:MAG: hypothetical protein ABEH43_09915, partial [Flavobacteriales bacterium]